jgi:hypothetical protein
MSSTPNRYQVHTPYLIDDSPGGAYDFTIDLDGNQYVSVPSPYTGEIVWDDWVNGYGHTVAVRDAETGRSVFMAHGNEESPYSVGDRVNAGDYIFTQGSTGNSTGPHLHWEFIDSGADWNDWSSITSNRITDRSVTRPEIEDYFNRLREGNYRNQTPQVPNTPPAFSNAGAAENIGRTNAGLPPTRRIETQPATSNNPNNPQLPASTVATNPFANPGAAQPTQPPLRSYESQEDRALTDREILDQLFNPDSALFQGREQQAQNNFERASQASAQNHQQGMEYASMNRQSENAQFQLDRWLGDTANHRSFLAALWRR